MDTTKNNELEGRVSYLNLFWYVGAFGMGFIAGKCGDKWNLGFLEETEHQVANHLVDYMSKLPKSDIASYHIMQQMRYDEEQHSHLAHTLGAADLPSYIKNIMFLVANCMKQVAWYI